MPIVSQLREVILPRVSEKMCVTGGNMRWNTMVSSEKKTKIKGMCGWISGLFFLFFIFIIALLIARESRKSVRYCFEFKVFPRLCLPERH